MSKPVLEKKEVLHINPYYQVYRVIANFRQHSKEYFVADFGEKAALIVDRDGSILLVKQYRLLPNAYSWEIPGGKVEPGEMPDVAAVRECFEETGVTCDRVKPLIQFHVGTDTVLSPTALFYTNSILGEGVATGQKNGEIVHHDWIPLAQCLDMIFRNEIVDGSTITALLAYQYKITSNITRD